MAHKPYATKKGASQPSKGRLPFFLIGGALALIIIGAFVLLRGSSAPAKPAEVAGKPKLAVDREQIDFGKVPLGKPVTAQFELSNVGDRPLQLAGVPKVELREGC